MEAPYTVVKNLTQTIIKKDYDALLNYFSEDAVINLDGKEFSRGSFCKTICSYTVERFSVEYMVVNRIKEDEVEVSFYSEFRITENEKKHLPKRYRVVMTMHDNEDSNSIINVSIRKQDETKDNSN